MVRSLPHAVTESHRFGRLSLDAGARRHRQGRWLADSAFEVRLKVCVRLTPRPRTFGQDEPVRSRCASDNCLAEQDDIRSQRRDLRKAPLGIRNYRTRRHSCAFESGGPIAGLGVGLVKAAPDATSRVSEVGQWVSRSQNEHAARD